MSPYPFRDLVQAYYDCRRSKRNGASALAFEADLERNLVQLHSDLIAGSYRPGRSICFVVTRPRPREVWASAFTDRIVHHHLYNRIGAGIERTFIADSCACIPGRGTLYAAERLESKIRSATRNWSRPVSYLKCDLANFFVSINKQVLAKQLTDRIAEPWWRSLALQVLWHDPRRDYEVRSPRHLFNQVPQHKRLEAQPSHLGLPIGNLSSQFFANIYLDALDQFVKHRLHCKHYVRYVDDFVLLHESPQQLNAWKAEIEEFLPALGARLNPRKTILQPVDRGVDFVGHVIKPWHRTTRKRTVALALRRTSQVPSEDLRETANSYFGLLTQASHSHKDRASLARVALGRGLAVNSHLTKTYPMREK
ncbi:MULTISPECIES: RNA-directed DNA polymerase [unclassified Pseudomonas]|uniref:RNA-directed DNA polymerase n=1 Tax=unclassified Pseudomonas TaxID=196821 RepID=UPI0024496ECA|nr:MULTISPECIES: RNA-directed DNA polymerase [unclassified Pseudomonas]MDG9928303.1 RNA-directed DNA polymerase [Pseudomonas sp. GD04042]MDH0481133.1 RNA-directed DNA polymerase [Pseudomonas sp. GD04015]MDH0604469.1 RNA-directed DNA polymerase [Pseudomonas sp. GD03869]